MNCPNCGTPVNEGYEFCTQCGAPVAQTTSYQQEYETNYTQPQATQENYQENYYVNTEVNNLKAKEYISGSKPSFILGIVCLATAVANFGLASIICGIISLIKLKGLPTVAEELITDPATLVAYQSAAKKAHTAKKLSTAGIIVAVVTEALIFIFTVLYALVVIGLPAIFVFIEEFM